MKADQATYFCTNCGNRFVLIGVRTKDTGRKCARCKSDKIYMY